MDVIYKNVDALIPYENNPRVNDNAVEAVAASIKEFGFRQPIVIDSEDVIIAGHTRLKAAIQLGLEKVPCIVADDLTEDQARAYRLADNKTAELAEWDFAALEEELAALSEVDMTQFGFADLLNEDQDIADKDDSEYTEVEEKTVECPNCGFKFSAIDG